jgi:hypothetical protein
MKELKSMHSDLYLDSLFRRNLFPPILLGHGNHIEDQ